MSSGSVAIDLVYRQVMGLKQDMNRISGGCAALRMRTDVATRMIRGQEFPSVFFVCYFDCFKTGMGGMSTGRFGVGLVETGGRV